MTFDEFKRMMGQEPNAKSLGDACADMATATLQITCHKDLTIAYIKEGLDVQQAVDRGYEALRRIMSAPPVTADRTVMEGRANDAGDATG